MTEKLAEHTLILIGCGKMGRALVEGLVQSGRFPGSQLVCIDAVPERARSMAEVLDARIEPEEGDARPRLYLLAVKPGDIPGAIDEHVEAGADDTVVSIAAGLSLSKLRGWVGEAPSLIRAMPNTPALVGEGVTGILADGEADLGLGHELFGAVGSAVELSKEEHFDALTAVSGSGPAYIFTAIEALADGGVRMGLDRETAIKLAADTVAGAARLVQEQENVHTAELKDRVASPAGTTIEALATLEEHGFRHALIRAVQAAAERSRAIGESANE